MMGWCGGCCGGGAASGGTAAATSPLSHSPSSASSSSPMNGFQIKALIVGSTPSPFSLCALSLALLQTSFHPSTSPPTTVLFPSWSCSNPNRTSMGPYSRSFVPGGEDTERSRIGDVSMAMNGELSSFPSSCVLDEECALPLGW